jgi:hypothetical protein
VTHGCSTPGSYATSSAAPQQKENTFPEAPLARLAASHGSVPWARACSAVLIGPGAADK